MYSTKNYLIICLIFNIAFLSDSKSSDMLKQAADLLDKESLQSSGVKCSRKQLNAALLDELRITGNDERIPCHIRYVSTHPTAGWIWSSLGALYTEAKRQSEAAVCFKQAAKLDGSVSKDVRHWYYVGPFPIGKSETDGDPLEAYGGIKNASVHRFDSDFYMLSEIAPLGKVRWSILNQKSSNGYVNVAPNMPWSELVNSLGSTGIMEWQGWAVGEISVNVAETAVLVKCMGVTNLFIDTQPVAGDVYHREQYKFAVRLSVGIHTVYVKTRAKANLAFRCDFDVANTAFEFHAPHFLPDLHDGHFFSGYMSFPVANHHASKWLRNIRLTLEDVQEPNKFRLKTRKSDFAIAPGQTRLVSAELVAESSTVSTKCNDVPLTVKLSTSEGQKSQQITLRCRKRHESFLFTFVDHDGSVQHAAVIRPVEQQCKQRLCPVVLTLHGTTVPPQNQADSYKRMINSQFVFGFQHAWLLAPTRHGAHNWEGPGALTALTALKQLSMLTSQNEWIKQQQSSPNFAVIAGHSMGGHGAWHVATHFPDMALTVISLSGWIRKEDYGDSNLFFRHDISTSHIEAGAKAVLEKCVSENSVDTHISNLKGVSVLIRTGANDRTVHPFFARRMFRLMTEAGLNVTYREIPDKDHWWWDTRETNDGGCINDKEIRDFTNNYLTMKLFEPDESCSESNYQCVSDGGTHPSSYSQPTNTENFTYTVSSVGFGGTVRGLKIIRQLIPYQRSLVVVEITESKATLKTSNVEILQIFTNGPAIRPVLWKSKLIEIDGIEMNVPSNEEVLCFCRELVTQSVRWTAGCGSCQHIDAPTERGPLTIGPARRVAERPFIIVIGTTGSNAVTDAIERHSVYISNQFFLTSDTSVSIIKDVDLTDHVADEHNLIVIGNPEENLYTHRFLSRLPLDYRQGVLYIKTCRYENPRTGVLSLAPHSKSRLALLLFGSSLEGLADIVSLATPTIPPMARSPFSNMIPDFVVTGPLFPLHGPGGFLCTGFWDNHWDFKPELTSCSQCCR